MTERELRGYIRKEIVINETYGFSHADLSKVWDSFTNVFTVTIIGLKSLLSVLVLNFRILFETDEEKIKTHFQSYETRSRKLAGEYDKALAPAREALGDIKPLLFLAAPGAYVATMIADSPTYYTAAKDFFQDIGLDISQDTGPDGPRRGTPGTDMGMASLLDRQKAIQARLDSIFGLAVKANESVLKEQTDSLDKYFTSVAKDVIPFITPDRFGIDKNALSSILDFKKKQADGFVKTIEAPIAFLEKLSNAKTIEDVKASLNLLQNTPFTLGGLEKITSESLNDAANKTLETAKKKNKLDALFKQINIEIPEKEKDQIEAIKAYQLKNLLGTTVLNAKKTITKDIELLRKISLEEFEKDAPLEMIKKIAPGSELEKVVSSGLEKIRNAAKQLK